MTAWLAEPDAAGVAPKYTFTTEASPEMLGDDDQWGPWRSAGCAAHKIRLVAVDGWGWSGSSFFHMEEAVSGRVIVDKKGEGNLKMDWCVLLAAAAPDSCCSPTVSHPPSPPPSKGTR